MGPNPTQPRSGSRLWLLVIGVLLLVGVIFTIFRPRQAGDGDKPKADPVAAARANAHGVGYMDQFDNGHAIEAFEEAEKLDPTWRPARINLGIALLNTQVPANLDRALGLFADVLKKEPDNPYAHYCTGIIQYYRNELEPAHKEFTRVTELDPTDAHAWYFRGKTEPDEPASADAKADYEKALKLNPYLNAARYALAQHGHNRDEDKSRALIAEWEKLKAADADDVADIKYTQMGRYATAIGASPVPPPPGGPLPPFDHARDGRPDVLLPGAGPGGRDVLLRNDGGKAFTDVTADLGLDKHPGGVGAAVGDFDNDGWPDFVLTGPAGARLFRNVDGKRFEDKTAEAGLDKLTGVCLGAAWLDLDQDGDLDLVVARYADTPSNAVKLLAGDKPDAGGRLAVFTNVGVAPPVERGKPTPPLSCKFQPLTWPDELKLTGPVVTVVAADLDGDNDVDLVVLVDGQDGVPVLNDRLMRFRRGDPAAPWKFPRLDGGLVIDADGDDRSDLVALPAGATPAVGLATGKPGATDSPPLRQAQRCDLDLDGRADLVGVSQAGKLVFLRGDGTGKFAHQPDALGPVAVSGAEYSGAAVADFDGDGQPDVFGLAADGLHLFRSLGNGNHGLQLTLTGRRDKGEGGRGVRTNAGGVGAKVAAYAGSLRASAELTTLTAGLGQSHVPVPLGLGQMPAADAVRVRWPDQVVQAELDQPAGRIVEIVEKDRIPTSCPVIFSWDGRRFAYVTDCLGAGSVGETGPDGSVRPPRPEEAIKIEPHQLAPKDGRYLVKVGEPMDELTYLDHLRLDVIDHPADAAVFPDERFATAGPQPTGELLVFRERIAPVKATDHRGRDVTAKLRHRDRDAVDGYAVRSWLGFAEEHAVELDFGAAAKSLPSLAAVSAGRGLGGRTPRLFLVLAGYTEYAYPESIYAAAQAGVAMLPPVLEQKQSDGPWKSLGDLGFPAGLTRVMTAEVTGRVDPAGGPLRIRTNLQIYWDQIYLAPLAGPAAAAVRELPVARAVLSHRGMAQEVHPGGKPPAEYDYDRTETVSVSKWRGRLTRFGDVTELLAKVDDRHAVIGPGDEVTAEFDAAGLPPVPAGWVRSYVLRTAGYCKDAAPTTQTGGRVGPLPHRGMAGYPYDPAQTPPHVAEYDRVWNTRPANGGAK